LDLEQPDTEDADQLSQDLNEDIAPDLEEDTSTVADLVSDQEGFDWSWNDADFYSEDGGEFVEDMSPDLSDGGEDTIETEDLSRGCLTFYVDPSTGDDSNSGTALGEPFKTLGAAVSQLRDCDVIELARGNYSGGGYIITADVTIRGSSSGILEHQDDITNGLNSGADATVLKTESGGRFFTIAGSATVTMESLRMEGGNSGGEPGGCILVEGFLTAQDLAFVDCTSNTNGGAIAVSGRTSLTRSHFQGNVSGGMGGAIYAGDGDRIEVEECRFLNNTAISGGAIATPNTDGNSLVLSSYFSGNSASAAGVGGAIADQDGLFINNSTFTQNSASAGAALSGAAGTTLQYCTVVDNHGLDNTDASAVSGAVTARRSILAGNDKNCAEPIVSSGHELFFDDDSCGIAFGSYPNTDPLLWPARDNGGFSYTFAFQPDS
ncbi:MAG: hypothetical protein KC561_19500, partial [Myxococcales bacterium]|nr:hypothetical protein [Myxococcales bacterium]